MDIKKIIYCLIFFIITVAQTYAADQETVADLDQTIIGGSNIATQSEDTISINELLSTNQKQKITPHANEVIEPFTGNLKLVYKDFSVPVAPGLNMEIMRSYKSDVYQPDVFYLNKNQVHGLVSQDWNFNQNYIRFPLYCLESGNSCKPVYVTANGEVIAFLADPNNPDVYRSNNNWLSEVIAGSMVITAPNGFKYYFSNRIDLTDCIRIYLTKIETPDGYYIEYHYNGVFVDKITSSNPNQVLTIEQQTYMLQPEKHGTKYYVSAPKNIYFNGNKIAEYNFNFIKHPQVGYSLVLAHAKLANDKQWIYDYAFQDIAAHNHKHRKDYKEILTSVTEPAAHTVYTYERDTTQQLSPKVHNLRIATITRKSHDNNVASGFWQFASALGDVVDGQLTKIVSIKNNYNTTINKYYNYQNDVAWRTGLLISSIIYKDHNVIPANILQYEHNTWAPELHNKEPYHLLMYYNYDVKHRESGLKYDMQTYRPRLATTVIGRGNDIYTTKYLDYDQYDNPLNITQFSNNKNQQAVNYREINQTFLNLTGLNILGLRTSLSISDGTINKTILTQEYDESGKLTKAKKFSKEELYSYDKGLLASSTDPMGNVTAYNSYKLGIPQDTIFADGTSEHQIINQYGQPVSSTNKKQHTTNYTYDFYGRLLEKTPPIGASTSYSYPNSLQMVLRHGDYTENTINTAYDLPAIKQLGNNRQINYRYDALGRKVFESYIRDIGQPGSAANGHYYNYDSLARIISDCQGVNCVQYQYLDNNTKQIIYPNGEYQIITYNAYGNPDNGKIAKISSAANDTIIKRDLLEHVTQATQGGVSKNYFYDGDYNLIKYTEPETGVTEYSYDKVGNLLERRQNGHKIRYQYNNQNYRLLNTSYQDNSADVAYSYDVSGNLTTATKGNITWSYQYDELDRLIAENLSVKDGPLLPMKVLYNYSASGNLTSMVYPDGSELDYQPNQYGEPTKVGQYLNSINYHPNGLWQGFNFANKVSASSQLDEYNRLKQYKYGDLQLEYTYDSNNNLTDLLLADAKSAGFNHHLNFNYDKSGRIIQAEGSWGKTAYTYDSIDNLVKINTQYPNATLNPEDLVLQYDNNYHLINIVNNGKANKAAVNKTNHFSYDSFGNVTSDYENNYTYGLDGNLLKTTGKQYSDYEYDHNQHRIIKTNTDFWGRKSKTLYFYNKAGDLLYEYDAKSQTPTEYIYFNHQRIAKVDKNVGYYYNDAVGSPVAMADNNGTTLWREVYQPFGMRTVQDKAGKDNKHWFAGKEVDANDLSYFGARYYNSIVGRFVAPDPVAVKPEDPKTFNRYTYANNNPYKYVDPDGDSPFLLGALGGAVGAIATSLYKGERDPWKIGVAGFMGSIVGGISALSGTIPTAVLYGGGAGFMGNVAEQGVIKGFNKIDVGEAIFSGANNGFVSGTTLGIATRIVPKLNLPYHPGFYTNYSQPTVRAVEYAPSEFKDAVTRSMYSIGYGTLLGFNTSIFYSAGKDFYQNNNFYKKNSDS